MYEKLKIKDCHGNLLKQYYHVNLSKAFMDDYKVWKIFLTSPGDTVLCRPFIDFDEKTPGAVLSFYSDASLNAKL